MSYNKRREAGDVIPIEPREVSDSTTATVDDGVILVNGPSVVDPGFTDDEYSGQFSNNAFDRVSNFDDPIVWGIGNEWTLMVWVKMTTNSTSRRICALSPTSGVLNQIDLLWSDNVGLGFTVRIVDDTSFSLDKQFTFFDDYTAGDGWVQIVLTWDGTLATSDQAKAWANGVAQTLDYTQNDAGINMADTSRYFRFGNSTGTMAGEIHSGCLWNVALTHDAIVTTYNGGNGAAFNIGSDVGNYTNSSDVRAWWRLGFAGENDPEFGEAFLDNTASTGADLVTVGTVPRVNEFPGGGSGQVTVTLPATTDQAGKVITVSDKLGAAGSLPVIIGATGSDNINGVTGESIDTARGSRSYVSDGVATWRNVSSGDAAGFGRAATDISYDNAVSGLTGENVQDALDDLALGGGGGGGGGAIAVSATGETATMTSEDAMLVTSGGVTITLPGAATVGSGAIVYVKDRDGNAAGDNITIEGAGAETIDGSLTYVITTNYQSVTLLSDGTNWSRV